MEHFKTSLIITSFMRPLTLRAVLSSVTRQTVLPDQVIIADDGSNSDVSDVVDEFRAKLKPVLCWQKNRDFRAARARNLAILKAESDHIIFVDGDCLLPIKFVEMHRRLIRPSTLVTGGRILLDDTQSCKALADLHKATAFCSPSLKHLIVPLGILRRFFSRSWRDVRTCNLGVWRSDLLRVDGFDGAYVGWGLEDSDLVIRLHRIGIKNISGRFGACVAHLFHEKQVLKNQSLNEAKFQRLLYSNATVPNISVLRNF